MKYVIYARKSSDEKSKNQKASLWDQVSWAKDYCKQRWIEPIEIFQESMSAKEIWRPLFNQMMKGFYEGKYDAVITWETSRLSRNSLDEWQIKHLISIQKLKEVHTKDSIYTENELFTLGIFLSMSQQEIAIMRKRIMRRMTAMVTQEWKVPFHAPMWYKNVGWGNIEIHPDEAPIVKRIFQMRIDGKSLQQIADVLNEDWIPTRSRNYPWSKMKWTKRLVEHVVKNEFYLWVVKFMDLVGEGIYEQFISRDIFEEANKEKRLNIGYRFKDFMLKGIVMGENGKPLTASKVKGKYVYYHNNGWTTKISEKEILKKLEEKVKHWAIPEDILPQVEEYIENTLFKDARALLEEKKFYEKKLEEISTSEFNLAKLCSKWKISEDMFDAQTREFIGDREMLNGKLQKLSGFWIASMEKFKKTIELVRNIYQFYKTADDITKGGILRASIIELRIETDGSLTVHEKEPFYWLSILNVPFGASNGTRTHNGRHGKAVL